MLVRLSDTTSLRDSKSSDVLAQWMSSSPLIQAGFRAAMDHAPLLAVHKTKVLAIRTHAEALFSAPYLIGVLLELGAAGLASACCLSTSPAGATPTPPAPGCPCRTGLLTHGVKARTPAFLWVIGMAVVGDKDVVALGQIWAQVPQVCSLHFRVHKLFIIRAFIIRKMPSQNAVLPIYEL